MLSGRNPYFIGINSAIFALVPNYSGFISRNPYFIGINSAIFAFGTTEEKVKTSQSLFYWN